MHYADVSTNYAYLPHNVDPSIPTPDEYRGMPVSPLGPDVKQRYDEYIQGCVDYYNSFERPKGKRCTSGEAERIDMTQRQPRSVYNYTELGFTKIRAPENVFKLIKEFWDTNRGNETEEKWIRKSLSLTMNVVWLTNCWLTITQPEMCTPIIGQHQPTC